MSYFTLVYYTVVWAHLSFISAPTILSLTLLRPLISSPILISSLSSVTDFQFFFFLLFFNFFSSFFPVLSLPFSQGKVQKNHFFGKGKESKIPLYFRLSVKFFLSYTAGPNMPLQLWKYSKIPLIWMESPKIDFNWNYPVPSLNPKYNHPKLIYPLCQYPANHFRGADSKDIIIYQSSVI